MKTFNVFFIIFLCSCLARPVIRKTENPIHQDQSHLIFKNIDSLAQSGDWLVTRGYNMSDNLVANATGVPLSHVAVFDKENGLVIEADNSGIHNTPIMKFIDKSYRVIIIRPRWRNNANAPLALENAHNLVGKNYDFLGTVGLNVKNRYYCTELAVFIYQAWHRPEEKLPKVIKPGELYLFGKILYDSLPRDEMSL